MQAVSHRSTEISLETGLRVADQLRDRLARAGVHAEFRLQGSVPLNVHIQGVSDVDLLAISTELWTYDSSGAKARLGEYRNPSQKTSVQLLRELRQQVEADLPNAFPAAKVDTMGAKSVKASGGSLPRDVDVVPSHWHDTTSYQLSDREMDRAVTIYNKKTGETIENRPFVHIDRIRSRCELIGGGLRKAIRLCKNIKADSERGIQLSSFDIGAIMYHADMNALRAGQFTDLAVLAETQRHLDALYANQALAESLMVPDGTRRIFDTPDKRAGLLGLSVEMDELLDNVFEENGAGLIGSALSRQLKRERVSALAI